jgi:hypothetical protein
MRQEVKKMDNHKINLKSKRKISLSGKNKSTHVSVPRYALTIRVPETDREVLMKIELKLRNLGVKKIYDQDKWHVGLNLFNKLLDYVEKQNINEGAEIEQVQEFIERMIEDKM